MLTIARRIALPRIHQTQLAILSRWQSSKREAAFDEAELTAARKWLADLNPETIPSRLCDISFSRSSGPGGQNVNKVSSKATLRVSTSSLLPLVPKLLHEAILSSRFYAKQSKDIVIQADEARKQGDNANSCHKKLLDLLREAGQDTIPGQTSAEQSERVRQLQRAEAAGRRKMKEYQSKKKAARRGGGGSDY